MICGLPTPYPILIPARPKDFVSERKINKFSKFLRCFITDSSCSGTILKKGISITPVKFGISFTTTHLNQGGALVHIYTDGSVHLNHGGIEMGQGLMTKISQIAANELGLSTDEIKITSTDTEKVPNTSASAASASTDINGAAVVNAINTIKNNLASFINKNFKYKGKSIKYKSNKILFGLPKFRQLVIAIGFEPTEIRFLQASETTCLLPINGFAWQ